MPNKEYFKGWYFKCAAKNHTVAFIPSFSRCENEIKAFLQIITDNEAFQLPLTKFKYREKPLLIKSGNNVFGAKGIKLDIKTDKLNINGALCFGKTTPIKYDIMGPFKFVPFMQCRHGVYSMAHRVDGKLKINGQKYIFNNGIGYIEGDCGTSFPKRYVWTQCSFPNGSIMLSTADIPLLGFCFTGIIGVVLLNGKEHRIATYLGAKLKHIGSDEVTISQGGYELTAKLLKKNAHPLSSPINGKMIGTIRESVSCTAYYRLAYKGRVLLELTSDRASFEFEYR